MNYDDDIKREEDNLFASRDDGDIVHGKSKLSNRERIIIIYLYYFFNRNVDQLYEVEEC